MRGRVSGETTPKGIENDSAGPMMGLNLIPVNKTIDQWCTRSG